MTRIWKLRHVFIKYDVINGCSKHVTVGVEPRRGWDKAKMWLCIANKKCKVLMSSTTGHEITATRIESILPYIIFDDLG